MSRSLDTLIFPARSAAGRLSVCLLLVLPLTAHGSDEIPGAPQDRVIALVNGVIHTVTGPPIEEGTIVFDKGRIIEIGRQQKPPAGAEVIDLNGRHVYPGLIEAHSHIGLMEIAAVRATIDYSETGGLNPNVSAAVSVNPDSEIIPVTRANGILIAVSAPTGGLVSGRASVMQLDGWTYEDMTLKRDIGMMVNWPRMTPVSFRGFGPRRGAQEDSEASPLDGLRRLFEQARAWQTARDTNPASQQYDIRLDAMQPVLRGEMPLIVAADRALEIQSAVAFSVEQNVRMILFGGHDAPMCADLLKQYDVPVIVSAVHQNPRRDDESYDSSYTLPERLRQAGIRFCISGSGRAETWNTRNLPYQAATAAAYGLPYEDALKSVTIYAAQILGIDDRVGTLEIGKDATLFVSDGDPLETETQIERAWVQGRHVELSSRHTRLYDKYRAKYEQLDRGR